MKVLITGAKGFLATHLIEELLKLSEISVITYTRNDGLKSLFYKLAEADFIFHLAGVNRPKNKNEFLVSNVLLTRLIVNFLLKNKIKTPLYFPSSIHNNTSTDYGSSKLVCETLLRQLKEENGSCIIVDHLPRVFGSGAKPNYNSVVATFCHNIANNLPIVISDKLLVIEMCHVGDWTRLMINILFNNQVDFYLKKYTIPLGDLVDILYAFKAGSNHCHKNICPDLLEKLRVTYQFYEP